MFEQRVPILDIYNPIIVETTNDMPFSLPETKYEGPFKMIETTSIICFDESFHFNPTLFF